MTIAVLAAFVLPASAQDAETTTSTPAEDAQEWAAKSAESEVIQAQIDALMAQKATLDSEVAELETDLLASVSAENPVRVYFLVGTTQVLVVIFPDTLTVEDLESPEAPPSSG